MSYSYNTPPITNCDGLNIHELLSDAFEKIAGNSQRENNTYFEAVEHLNAAAEAATNILSALGAVHMFTISVLGHANPGHKPRDGWANDFCDVKVSVLSYVTEEVQTEGGEQK